MFRNPHNYEKSQLTSWVYQLYHHTSWVYRVFVMPTWVLVWIPQRNLLFNPFFDCQRRQGFQWPLAKGDPALVAVLELGLSEEPAEAAPAELSEAGGFYDTYDISCLSLPNIQRPLLHLCLDGSKPISSYQYIYIYNYILYIWGPISIHKSHHSPAKTYELTIFGAHDAINCHKSQQLIRVSRSHLLRLRLLLRLPGACWSALRGGRRRPWRPATQRPWRKWRTRRSGQGSPGVTMETRAVNRCIWACGWYFVA
jgi:hypothetical protein